MKKSKIIIPVIVLVVGILVTCAGIFLLRGTGQSKTAEAEEQTAVAEAAEEVALVPDSSEVDEQPTEEDVAEPEPIRETAETAAEEPEVNAEAVPAEESVSPSENTETVHPADNGNTGNVENVTAGEVTEAAENVTDISTVAVQEEENAVQTVQPVTQTTQTTAAPVITSAGGTPVAQHGELSVQGTALVDKNGAPFQIRGVSTHGIAWFPQYVNKSAFQTLRDEWGANCIRLAMYSAEYSGYCTGGDQSQLKQLVNNGVSYATELGMYVIIDWHVLGDQDPTVHQDSAIAFFNEMSSRYANYDNVLYEICNEPNGGTNWQTIKAYAEKVIPVIKSNNPDAVIIVGTPTWSQEVDKAAADPITGYSNIMYTIHFYAGTHKASLRQKMTAACAAGLPIFCTEFGTCDASGNGGNDFAEANRWIETLNDHGISYCIWSLCNKNETSALISSSCSKTSGWTREELSDAGRWYVDLLGGGVNLGTTVTDNSNTGNNNNGNDNSNNNSSSNNGGNNNSTQTTTAQNGNLTVSVANSGGWTSGSGQCYQYTVTLRNTGSGSASGWKVVIEFPSSVTLDQSWSGNFTQSGNSFTVTPVDYNSTIGAGGSVEIGLIVVSSSSSLGLPSVRLE